MHSWRFLWNFLIRHGSTRCYVEFWKVNALKFSQNSWKTTMEEFMILVTLQVGVPSFIWNALLHGCFSGIWQHFKHFTILLEQLSYSTHFDGCFRNHLAVLSKSCNRSLENSQENVCGEFCYRIATVNFCKNKLQCRQFPAPCFSKYEA